MAVTPVASAADPNYMQSLARGLDVLATFATLGSPLSVPQIAAETGLSRAVVKRCLHTLALVGYVEERDHRYSARPRVLVLAESYLSPRSLPGLAQPVLEDLRDALGESCSLGVLEGPEIVYVARASAMRIMTIALHVGSRLPAIYTSMGRVLIAALPADRRGALLDDALFEARTPKSITDRHLLEDELRRVSEQGYALVEEELELGLRSIAVPVWNRSRRVVAALNVGASAARVGRKDLETRILPRLRAAADEMSRFAQ